MVVMVTPATSEGSASGTRTFGDDVAAPGAGGEGRLDEKQYVIVVAASAAEPYCLLPPRDGGDLCANVQVGRPAAVGRAVPHRGSSSTRSERGSRRGTLGSRDALAFVAFWRRQW